MTGPALALELPLDFRPHGIETQRDVARAITADRRARDKDRALTALTVAGPGGLTDFELEGLTGVKQTSIGKRRLDLERDGLVGRRLVWVDGDLVPDRRAAPSGARVAVWALIDWCDPAGRGEA